MVGLFWLVVGGGGFVLGGGSSAKRSNPGHLLKSQGKFFLSFPCTLFYIFLTPKNYNLSI